MTIRRLSLIHFLLFPIFLLPGLAWADGSECPVDSKWLTSPSLPSEVKRSGSDGSSTFCDFYQFSTQTFLYLMSPAGSGNSTRNFQVAENYPLLEFDENGNPANSCDSSIDGPTLRTSLSKASSISTEQAGGGATIYAQDKNVVYYDVRFNSSLCNLTGSAVEMQKQNLTNFPSGTMELKFAWKKLSQSEIASKTFVTQQQEISGSTITLGLVGMHIAVATTDHPEFVWATYEHKINTPDCLPSGVQTDTSWTFSSKACTEGLPGAADESNTCKFNQPPKKQSSPTGTPTNICRVHPYGTASGDLKAGENISDISNQNSGLLQVLGQSGTSATMKVLSNYFNIGALWVSNIQQSSGGIGVPNERGSLRLANSVAETDFQDVDITNSFASNCFGCHNYAGKEKQVSNNITSQALSHTFKNIKTGQGQAVDITASNTIGSNSSAPEICGGDKGTCTGTASYLKWNGNWTNMNASAGSVCGCVLAK